MGKECSSQIILENWISTCKRMRLDSYLAVHIRMDSKYIKDTNISVKTIKHFKGRQGKSFMTLDLSMTCHIKH
jgi:hypothetical protein